MLGTDPFLVTRYFSPAAVILGLVALPVGLVAWIRRPGGVPQIVGVLTPVVFWALVVALLNHWIRV